ncbi:MAG: hypothetical protein QOF85_1037 [Solirubrobacterales bacterium]|jgi:hypothetical protein|nr:hypothetical protein [Solirubrobacterales bacterium]
MAERERRIEKSWWAFRIGMWALGVSGATLVFLGQFWLGVVTLLCAAAVRIGWGEWSRRQQALLDADADEAHRQGSAP